MQQLMSRGISYSLCVLMLIAATFSVAGAQQVQYGVYIGDQSVVNPNPNFNLYSAGANSKNVFDGNVGIGTTTPATMLEVRGPSNGEDPATSLVTIARFYKGSPLLATLDIQLSDRFAALVPQSYSGGGHQVGLSFWTRGLGVSTGEPFERVRITPDGNVGIGTTTPTSRLYVVGDITATGGKNFQIAHPVEPERKLLIHSALEGPEAAVYYRGEAQLKDGKAMIALPAYFEALTRKEQRTVQLTPIDDWSPLYVVEGVQDGQFTVRTAKEGNPAQRFYWEVKAVRADVPTLVVEKLKAAD